MMRIKALCAFSVAGVAALLVGCGGGTERVATYKAGGKVTYTDGSPVKGLYIVFDPVEPEGVVASGRIKADGTYTLRTYDRGDGAMAGKFKVYITSMPQNMDAEDQDPNDPIGLGGAGEGDPSGGAAPSIDGTYLAAATSPLTAEVKAEDNQTFDFKVPKATGGGGAPKAGP